MLKIVNIHSNEYLVYMRCQSPGCTATWQFPYCGPKPKPTELALPNGWKLIGGKVLCNNCTNSRDTELNLIQVEKEITDRIGGLL